VVECLPGSGGSRSVQLGDLSHELLTLFAFWKLVSFGGQAFEVSHDPLLFGIVCHRFTPLSDGLILGLDRSPGFLGEFFSVPSSRGFGVLPAGGALPG
jgi:hypothetical protein